MSETSKKSATRRSGAAATIAAGILVSRVFGLLRERAVAHFFGVGAHADVFSTALRGPNILQNLLGEQSLSAAFIPVYSRLLAEGREEEAGRFAGAVFGLLLAATSSIVLISVLLARPIVALLAPGFLGDAQALAQGQVTLDRFELAVAAVRVIFPMAGILVLSAWALGILNSHRRFFLPYFAPVLWNVAIISALVWTGSHLLEAEGTGVGETLSVPARNHLLLAGCWGALLGGLLQFAVQLPLVTRLMRGFRLSLSTRVAGVRDALRAFGPVVAGRGAVQISAYLDLFLASLLTAGALGALRWGQHLYLLPVSLFGMSVAAAELPELSREAGAEAEPALRERAARSLRQVAYLSLPAALGYLALGFLVVGALYRTGSFTVAGNWLVYLILCAYSLGIVPSAFSRLMQNLFYALQDTRTPAKIAVQRVVLAAGMGAGLMLWLDRYSVGETLGLAAQGGDLYLGAVGLALGSGLASWFELWRLRSALAGRLPGFRLPWAGCGRMVAAAVLALAGAGGLWWWLPPTSIVLQALAVLACYGGLYLVISRLVGVRESEAWLGRWIGR